MRIGIDLGGTKIEALALSAEGVELGRHRVDTPRGDYAGTLGAMRDLVTRLERETGAVGTVGAGIPGCLTGAGLVKNANSTWLNGRPLGRDFSELLGREVRVANDANCLAVSEATDGAAAGSRVVFAVILGTGCGGGVALGGEVHAGPNGVAGEWGHTSLPWPRGAEAPGPACYCGKRGCMEQWVSGTGLARDFTENGGGAATGREVVMRSEAGDALAEAAMQRLEDRLARGLAGVIHVLDPDVIVVGGGLSRAERIYGALPALLRKYVFGGECETPVRAAVHGDSSGVRGAAWLWPAVSRAKG